jgi:hypothetical protein
MFGLRSRRRAAERQPVNVRQVLTAEYDRAPTIERWSPFYRARSEDRGPWPNADRVEILSMGVCGVKGSNAGTTRVSVGVDAADEAEARQLAGPWLARHAAGLRLPEGTPERDRSARQESLETTKGPGLPLGGIGPGLFAALETACDCRR